MTTPEKSVKEIVEELMKHKTYFDTIEGKQGYILSERVKFYLTQTLQTERQKREDIWKCTVDILEDIKEFSGGTDSELETYIDEQIQALTQPNNPK